MASHSARALSVLMPIADRAYAALEQYYGSGCVGSLDDALTHWHTFFSHPQIKHLVRDTRLAAQRDRADIYITRYFANRDPVDLEKAQRLLLEISHQLEDGHLLRGGIFHRLATIEFSKYQQNDDAVARDRGLVHALRALDLYPKKDPERCDCLLNAGRAFYNRFEEQSKRSDLDRAIDVLLQLSGDLTDDDSDRTECCYLLGMAYNDRYNLHNNSSDLDLAIAYCRSALPGYEDGSEESHAMQANIAFFLSTRYAILGDRRNLDEALKLFKSVWEKRDGLTHGKTLFYINYGNALLDHFQLRRKRDDLNLSIEVLQIAAATSTATGSQMARAHYSLACAINDRFDFKGNPTDLEQSLRQFQKARIACSQDPDLLLFIEGGIAEALKERFLHSRKETDLERALTHARKGLSLARKRVGKQWYALWKVAVILGVRFDHTGDPEDLSEALRHGEKALKLAPPHAPERAQLLKRVAELLLEETRIKADPSSRERALCMLESAVSGDKASLPKVQESNGDLLLEQYEYDRKPATLAAAFQSYLAALAVADPGTPIYRRLLFGLANAHMERYKIKGNLEDLNLALAKIEESLAGCGPRDPDRPGSLNTRAILLFFRFQRIGKITDLDQAIEVWEALRRHPIQHQVHQATLLHLSHAYTKRFLLEKDPEDAGRSQTAADELMDDLGVNHAWFPWALEAKLNATVLFYEVGGPTDIEQMNELIKLALNTAMESPEERVGLLYALAAVSCNFVDSESSEDEKLGVQIFFRLFAKHMETMPAEWALRGTRNWLLWSFGIQEWDFACETVSYLRRADTAIFKRQLTRGGRFSWLREVQGIYACTAFALLANNQIENAMLHLEESSARLLRLTMGRSALLNGGLEQENPELFSSFKQRLEVLLSLENQVLDGLEALDAPTDIWDRIRQARDAFDQVTEALGFNNNADSSHPTTLADLGALLSGNEALVYLATTDSGTMILILMGKVIRTFPSPLTRTEISDLVARAEGTNPQGNTIDCILKTLGNLLGEATHFLGKSGTRSLVLVPIGLLARLPLPATPLADGQTLDHHFKVTCVPNAYTLKTRQNHKFMPHKEAVLVAVADPHSVFDPLPAAQMEMEQLITSSYWRHVHQLTGENGSSHGLLDVLPDSDYIHLACHGRFDSDTGEGYLTLHDGALPLSRISRMSSSLNARLAVFSSCRSGFFGQELLDETIGLPVAFLQLGVDAVVATLWDVDDMATACFMTFFYRFHLEKGLPPIEALSRARGSLREATAEELRLVDRYQDILEKTSDLESRVDAIRKLAYYRRHLNFKPFTRPHYWAGFVLWGR